MSRNEKKTNGKKRWSGLIGMLILLAGSAGAGVLGGMYIDRLTGGDESMFFICLGAAMAGLLLAMPVQIVLHEAGHLVFGLRTGYQFVSFNVMGIIWQKGEDGKIRRSRLKIAGAGGQCLMAPPEYNDGNFPFTLYNLGGVLINLITAVLFALLAAFIPWAPVKLLMMMETFIGVFFALTNGLPIPVAALQNDGKNLLCIRRDGEARRAFWLQMAVAAEIARGRRLKEMPDEWFTPFPEETMDNPIVSTIAVLNCSRLMDQLDFAAAEAEIRRLMAREKGIIDLHRMLLSCDGATCELIAGRPADLTESLTSKTNQQLMKAMPENPSILRARYAAALLRDKDAAAADKVLAEFDKAAPRYPNPQEIASEREIMAVIREKEEKVTA